MDMKKTAKKIAALVAGTTMLGATIMGATALDLSNYPAPFVTDGVFSGKIVVGAKAATSDVVGAIDLAASLQAASKTTTEVTIPGAAGQASVTGDSTEFKVGSDVVSIGETLGSVKQTFTETDLKALKSGVLQTGSAETPVKQYLKFDNTSMYVKYAENDDNMVADYLYVPDSSVIFEYHMEFTEGASSDHDDGINLDDYEGEVITMIGAPYTIVQAKRTGAALNSFYMSMLGGQVADVLKDGETKTYTIDGKDYEVTAVFISSDSPAKAKLSVNGVMTKELAGGATQVLGGDVTVGIQSILTNQREGIVEFYLGANKLEITDSSYLGTTYDATGTVKVNGKSLSNGEAIVKATNDSSTSVKLNYIKYRLLADTEYFVPSGKGVKEFLIKPEELLTDTWDIKYAGFVLPGDSIVKFKSKSDYAYDLEFENILGEAYSFPLITNKNGVFRYGDDDDDFIFVEPNMNTSAGTNGLDNETFISDNDYFLVADRATQDGKAVSSILRYQSISTGDSTVTFKDLAGSDVIVSYSGTVGAGAMGELIVHGATHKFYVGNNSATASEKYALAMDLNADSLMVVAGSSTEVKLVSKGGQVWDLGTQYLNATGTGTILTSKANVTVTTSAAKYDEAADGPETSTVIVSNSTTVIDLTAVINGTGGESLLSLPDKDEYSIGYTDYGIKFELYNPTTANQASDLTVSVPLSQRYVQAFVTAGTVEVKGGTATTGGKLSTTALNPIAVGLAVLDTDAPAIGSGKMIVVGGPCVNTKAAELMGNPTDCVAGFTPGKAVIKLFAEKNALLVAGYGAQDTLGACYVLAAPSKYELSGNEVEVVVADLNTITVNKVN
ncbi:MAG: S-layer protein [archaeon]